MKLCWTEISWTEYLDWQITDVKKFQRINELIKDIKRSPFQGVGKPEPLKFDLIGKWSRRIDEVHRLVYDVKGKKENANNKIIDNQILTIYQCKYHY